MFLLQVAGAEAVWRCSAERSACRYSGTDLGLGHCGPDGLALRAPLIASACIHARRPRRFWVLPVRLRLILSTAVKPFATRQTSIACLVWQGQRFCETFQALGLASESILSDSLSFDLAWHVARQEAGDSVRAFLASTRRRVIRHGTPRFHRCSRL
jgi:hypothetical protein